MKKTHELISNCFKLISKFLPLQVICILFFGIATYFGTLNHSFHFDDWPNIENNPSIQISELSYDSLRSVSETFLTNRPVAYISFALNYYFHGLDVTGYHLVNVFIHLLTGILLYYFVHITFRLSGCQDDYVQTRYIPFFVALIWLIHPLQVQSVTYIVQRMNSMGAMFYIMAILCYVKARITPNKMLKAFSFFASLLAAMLAFGSKENTLTLPLFIALYESYFLHSFNKKVARKHIFWMMIYFGILLFISYHFLLKDISLPGLFSSRYDYRTFSLGERLLTEPRVVLHYISLLIFPYPGRLNLDYNFPLSHSLFSPLPTLGAISVLAGLLCLALFISTPKNRLYSFCILWFFGNLIIESSFIALEIAYEHRLYLPSMMGVFLLVLIFHQVTKKKTVMVVSLALLVFVFSYWTCQRNKVWQNDITLWSDSFIKSPDKSRVNQNLGLAYFLQERFDDALPYFHRALNLYFEEIKSQNKISGRETSLHLRNLAKTYKAKGNYGQAIKYYEMALKYFYFDAESHFRLGECYESIKNLDKAVYQYGIALRFASHHSSDLELQKKSAYIKKRLNSAQVMLNAQQSKKI